MYDKGSKTAKDYVSENYFDTQLDQNGRPLEWSNLKDNPEYKEVHLVTRPGKDI